MIPKIIHQTAPNKTFLDPLFKKNIDFLRENNPDWEYRLYDNDDCRKFIQKKFNKEYLISFDKIHPDYGAAKADFFRYLLMYVMGGLYLDIKSSAKFPLSKVMRESDSYLLSYWDNGEHGKYPKVGYWPEYGVDNELQQWFIACEPRHPFLEEVILKVKNNIEKYNPFIFGIGGTGVIRTTGPVAYSLAIQDIKNQHAHRLVNIEDMGLEYSFLRDQKIDVRRLIGNDYTKSKKFLTATPLITRFLYSTYHWVNYDLKILIRHPIPKSLKIYLKNILKMRK